MWWSLCPKDLSMQKINNLILEMDEPENKANICVQQIM